MARKCTVVSRLEKGGYYSYFGVNKDWLQDFIKHGLGKELLDGYLDDPEVAKAVDQIYLMGSFEGKVAFKLDPGADNPCTICGAFENWKLRALIEFIAQDLEDSGYKGAAQYVHWTFLEKEEN